MSECESFLRHPKRKIITRPVRSGLLPDYPLCLCVISPCLCGELVVNHHRGTERSQRHGENCNQTITRRVIQKPYFAGRRSQVNTNATRQSAMIISAQKKQMKSL